LLCLLVAQERLAQHVAVGRVDLLVVVFDEAHLRESLAEVEAPGLLVAYLHCEGIAVGSSASE
jgi:hypothetical protein